MSMSDNPDPDAMRKVSRYSPFDPHILPSLSAMVCVECLASTIARLHPVKDPTGRLTIAVLDLSLALQFIC